MKQRGYQYKLHPSDEQATGNPVRAVCCRLVYNVALEQRRDCWRQFKACTGNSINHPAQAGELTMLREEYDWIRAVHDTLQQQALHTTLTEPTPTSSMVSQNTRDSDGVALTTRSAFRALKSRLAS